MLWFIDHTLLDTDTLGRNPPNQLVTQTATYTTHNKHNSHIPMHLSGLETAIPGSISLQNYIRYGIAIVRSKIAEKREEGEETENLIYSY